MQLWKGCGGRPRGNFCLCYRSNIVIFSLYLSIIFSTFFNLSSIFLARFFTLFKVWKDFLCLFCANRVVKVAWHWSQENLSIAVHWNYRGLRAGSKYSTWSLGEFLWPLYLWMTTINTYTTSIPIWISNIESLPCYLIWFRSPILSLVTGALSSISLDSLCLSNLIKVFYIKVRCYYILMTLSHSLLNFTHTWKGF